MTRAALEGLVSQAGHASLSSTEVYHGVETSDVKHMIERSHPRERARERVE